MRIFQLLKQTISAVCAIAAVCPAYAAAISSGELARPEGARHYLLGQPAQASDAKLPLVIILHGHGGSAAMEFGRDKIGDPAAAWLDVVEREHVLVLAPDGTLGNDDKRGWNDCRADAPTNPKTDDVAFIGALIDTAIAKYHADPQRVFISGISNGGGMAYRAAIELGPRLAGVAVLSALMPAHSLCAAPTHALPLLVTHGTADKIAPYAGGEVGHWLMRGRGSGVSVDESVKIWRELAHLPATPQVGAIAKRDPAAASSVIRYVWGSDPAQLQVTLLKVDQGGHNQPSISHRLTWLWLSLLGAQNGDIEFVDEAWRFFKDKRVGLAPPA